MKKSELRQIIKEEIKLLNEKKINKNDLDSSSQNKLTQDFTKKWTKALDLAKQSGYWSPHMKYKDKTKPANVSIPEKYRNNFFGYRSNSRFITKLADGDVLDIVWGGDAKKIMSILNKAGFKTKWGGNERDTIQILDMGQ